MSVIVIKEECNGCEECLASCPYEAIEMVDGVAWINEKCTICLACIEACPVEAIIQEESKVELPDLDKQLIRGSGSLQSRGTARSLPLPWSSWALEERWAKRQGKS